MRLVYSSRRDIFEITTKGGSYKTNSNYPYSIGAEASGTANIHNGMFNDTITPRYIISI